MQLSVLPFCNEFHNASTAMTVYCGVFAASSVMFTLFKVCDDNVTYLFCQRSDCVVIRIAGDHQRDGV